MAYNMPCFYTTSFYPPTATTFSTMIKTIFHTQNKNKNQITVRMFSPLKQKQN